jgi:phenylalanyl-tRNA synthetase alpha chain
MQKIEQILKDIYITININDYIYHWQQLLEENFSHCENLDHLQRNKNYILNLLKTALKNLDKISEDYQQYSSILNNLKQLVFDIYKQTSKLFIISTVVCMDKIYLPLTQKISTLHPLTITIKKIYDIMKKMNFTWEDVPEIDDPIHIFDNLNMDIFHPARADQQSFVLKNTHKIPRTQCTNLQSHIIRKWNEKDDIHCFSIGNVYRYDSDATHTPNFKQLEILFINNQYANLATLMGFLDDFFEAFFGYKMEKRIRTSYFPFTEISYEVDIKLDNNWLEICGCGMIHPYVFQVQNKNIVHGWALGLGIERLTMIATAYKDIRKFYQNDIRYY